MKTKNKVKIGIIGFGRFGKILAKILKKSKKISEIEVSDRVNKQKEAKIIGLKFSKLEDTLKKDIIILAIPISKLEKFLKKTNHKFKNSQIVMDVCSVKEYPVKLMKKYLPKDVEILASHPMFGPDSVKYGLKNLQIAFWPVRIKKKNYQIIKDIFKDFGLKIIEIPPKEHDRQTAISLCFVHFLGRSIEKLNFKMPKIQTYGFKKLMEVAENVKNDTRQLFLDIQKYNQFAKKQREKFLKIAEKLNKRL